MAVYRVANLSYHGLFFENMRFATAGAGTTMNQTDEESLTQLLINQPWVALATRGERGPYGAMVSVAWQREPAGFLCFLSTLSLHTRQLLANGACCLVIAEPYTKACDDPQTLPRVSIECLATAITRDHLEFDACKQHYLARFPTAIDRFELGDFLFFRLEVQRARMIAGFGRAVTLTSLDIAGCWG